MKLISVHLLMLQQEGILEKILHMTEISCRIRYELVCLMLDIAAFHPPTPKMSETSRQEGNYELVSVLLLSWEGCEEPITAQLQKLQSVIQHYYNYGVEHWTIPLEVPYRSLDRKLSQYIDRFDGPSRLLVVYYRGHATKDGTRTGLIWKV